MDNIKTFGDKQKLKEFANYLPPLQEMLKREILSQSEENSQKVN